MRTFVRIAALPALALAAAGCQVNVDNKTAAQIDNAADMVGAAADAAGNRIETGADALGNAVERGVDAVDNRVDVNVNLHSDGDGNAAEANRH